VSNLPHLVLVQTPSIVNIHRWLTSLPFSFPICKMGIMFPQWLFSEQNEGTHLKSLAQHPQHWALQKYKVLLYTGVQPGWLVFSFRDPYSVFCSSLSSSSYLPSGKRTPRITPVTYQHVNRTQNSAGETSRFLNITSVMQMVHMAEPAKVNQRGHAIIVNITRFYKFLSWKKRKY
jgi:hypothetical protein